MVKDNNNQTLYEMLRQNILYFTNVATKTRTSITYYDRRVEDS